MKKMEKDSLPPSIIQWKFEYFLRNTTWEILGDDGKLLLGQAHLGPFENRGVQHWIGFISMTFKSKVDSGEVGRRGSCGRQERWPTFKWKQKEKIYGPLTMQELFHDWWQTHNVCTLFIHPCSFWVNYVTLF